MAKSTFQTPQNDPLAVEHFLLIRLAPKKIGGVLDSRRRLFCNLRKNGAAVVELWGGAKVRKRYGRPFKAKTRYSGHPNSRLSRGASYCVLKRGLSYCMEWRQRHSSGERKN